MHESFDDFPAYTPPIDPTVRTPAEDFSDFPEYTTPKAVAPIAPVSSAAPEANPFANTSLSPAAPDAFLPDSVRHPILAMNAIGKGLSSMVTGIPDLVAAPISGALNKMQGRPFMEGAFPLTRGAEAIGTAAEKAVGVPDVTPKTWQEKLGTNALTFGSGALVPEGLIASGLSKAAPIISKIAPETGAALAEPLVNYPRLFTGARVQQAANARSEINPSLVGAISDKLAPTAATLAAGAGAGGAATLAEEQAPDSPMAAVLAAFLGAHAGTGAAKMAGTLSKAPVEAASRMAQGTKLEPAFQSEGPSLTLPNKASNVDAAARIFQDMTEGNPSSVADVITKNAKAFAGDAVQQTPANLSQDYGLMRLEKGARLADQKTGNRFIANDQALQQQNVNDFKKIAPAETGNKQFTVDTIAAQAQKVKDDAAATVAAEQAAFDATKAQSTATVSEAEQKALAAQIAAKDQIRQAQAEADKLALQNKTSAQDISATPRMPREQAGESLVNDVLLPNKQAQVQQYRNMIAPFEADKSTPINTEAARASISKVNSDIATGVDVGPDKALIDNATKILANNDRTGVNSQGLASTRQSSPAELLQLEQKLNQASRDAKAAGRGASVNALNTIRQGINDVLDKAGLGEDFKNSRDFYRENVAEPFQHDTSGKVLAAGSNGEQLKNVPGEAIGKYFKAGPAGGAGMDQLISAGGGVDKVQPYIQSHVAENMVDKFYNPTTSEFNVPQMRKYLNDNREAFARMPDVRDDWNRIANQLDSGKSLHQVALGNVKTAAQQADQVKLQTTGEFNNTKNQVNQNLQLAKQRVADVQAEAAQKVADDQKTAVKFYLNDPDPDKAIARVLGSSNNPARDLTDLRIRAEKDKSGKALLGLKEAIYDNLQSKIEKATKLVKTGDSAITPSDMLMLKNNQTALVKSGIFSAKDNEILNTLQNRITTAQRGVDLKATGGSATAENETLSETQKAIARSSLRTIFGGFEGGNKYSVLKDTLSLVTGQDQKARAINHIIQRSLLDPQLAVLLLKRDLSKYEESLFVTKINRVLTNRTALAYTQGEQSNGR